MVNYFTHKILFASTFPVGFGDAITNTVIVKYFAEKFKHRVLFHYYFNETIVERNGWHLYHHLPCDKVFTHPFHWHDTQFNLYRFHLLGCKHCGIGVFVFIVMLGFFSVRFSFIAVAGCKYNWCCYGCYEDYIFHLLKFYLLIKKLMLIMDWLIWLTDCR